MSDRPAQNLKVEEIKVPKGHQHPPPDFDVLPKHEFSMLMVAPKGSGKTTLICNLLLKFYKGYFHEIWVFSPTIGSDEKWDTVKRTKGILTENKKLKTLTENKSGKGKAGKAGVGGDGEEEEDEEGGPEFSHLMANVYHNPYINFGAGSTASRSGQDKKFTGKIPLDHFKTEYDEDDLREIMKKQMAQIKKASKMGHSKHICNRILFVFDDMVGSSLFSGMRANPFKTLNANLRHHSASLLMITQSYKEIPKVARVNTSCLIAFSVANEKELFQIYEENPSGMKKKQWMLAFHHATSEPFAFFFINYQRPREQRIMRNFEAYLKITTVQDGDDSDMEESGHMGLISPTPEQKKKKSK